MTTKTTSKTTDAPAYELFVDQSTRDNYTQIARDLADSEGITPKAAMAKLATGFAEQHERDPLGGWDHLAAWAKAEPDPGPAATPETYGLAKAVESARRDPQVSLPAHPDAIAAAEEALERQADTTRPEGTIANTGPVSTGTESS